MQALERYYSFKSYQEFGTFEALLAQRLAAGQLLLATPLPATGFLSYQPDAWYQLAGSSEVWALSTPDNAWRGYFLPLTEALVYQQRLRRRDKVIRLIGLLALTMLGFTIWRLVS